MKIRPSRSISLVAALLCMNATAATNDASKGEMGMGNMDMGARKTSKEAKPSLAEGEVKAVDRASKTITIKHGPVKSKTVEMGPMTMTFPVKNPAMLSPSIKEGSKVRFQVENVDGTPTVTTLKSKP